jgi:hypothetical protein
MNRLLVCALIFLPWQIWASPAVLIEEGESRVSASGDLHDQSYYSSAINLRDQRRVGIGFQGAGSLGVIGAFVELNFSAEDSAVVGFGGGPRYRTLNFAWKSLLLPGQIAPYVSVGYSRWYNNTAQGGPLIESNPGILSASFLSDEEKSTGHFGKDFLFPALGVQFYQLSGAYAGISVFAEIQLMTSLETFKMAPTGALGSIYYF